MPPNTACSRPAQLPKLCIRFDGWRSGRWRAADAEGVGRLQIYNGGITMSQIVIEASVRMNAAVHYFARSLLQGCQLEVIRQEIKIIQKDSFEY